MIKDQIIQHSSRNQGDYNNFFINANPLTQKAQKICIILCNFVNSKSPKTKQQKGYSNHEFYTSNCVKMYNFWKKCVIKQPKINKEKTIQPLNHSKIPAKSDSQSQNTIQKLHTFLSKKSKQFKMLNNWLFQAICSV